MDFAIAGTTKIVVAIEASEKIDKNLFSADVVIFEPDHRITSILPCKASDVTLPALFFRYQESCFTQWGQKR